MVGRAYYQALVELDGLAHAVFGRVAGQHDQPCG